MKSLFKNQSGSALLAITLMMPFIILIAALYTQFAVGGLVVAKRDQSHTHAQFATDAGIDAAMEQINSSGGTWAGTGGEIEVQNDGKVRTTYEATVTDIDATHKSLVSTGRTFRPAGAASPESTVTVTVMLRPVTTGLFSVASGVGGLYLQNSAKILGGDVLVNGEISMTNTSQIGLTTNPVTVKVAHQNCPNPATSSYPRLCASGENGQPISMNNSAQIYGEVEANNQVSGAGMSNPGLTSGSGVPVQALPTHNRTQQKANVTLTTSDSSYLSCNSGTRTWPAKLKIVGNVTISNSCNVILEGDVWITGTLTVRNSGRITVQNGISLGGTNTVDNRLPTIMIDGASGLTVEQSGALMSNAASVGMQVVTYWSRASCSPDCSDVTGVDLYNSRNDRTVHLQNSAQAPNSILFARWTQLELANGGGVGAVVGQTVRLSNSASVTFGVSAGVGTTSWVIDNYRRTF